MKCYTFLGINPEPWEAPQGQIIGASRRAKGTIQFHRTQKQRAYQEAIKEEAAELFAADPIDFEGPFKVRMYFWRALDHADIGGWTAKQADATNLQKATEDALQGYAFDNDRHVHDIQSVIIKQESDVEPAVMVTVAPAQIEIEYGWVQHALDSQRQAATRSHPGNIRSSDQFPSGGVTGVF